MAKQKPRPDKSLIQKKRYELQDIQNRIKQIESDIETKDLDFDLLSDLNCELNELYIKQKSVRLIGETKTNCILPHFTSSMVLKGRAF